MNKLLVSGSLVLALALATPALAQSYYSYPTGTSSCVSIPAGLSQGSRGTDVTNLQNFLVAQNYPGGGSWMVTGYFGAATAAAVRNFQESHGIPQTGSVDAATASAINVSCGGGGTSYVPSYPNLPTGQAGNYNYNYNYNTNPTTYYPNTYLPVPNTTYPYNNQYYYGQQYYGNAPTITSLSQNTGTVGNVVTIYGVGFDPTDTVNFGSVSVQGVSSNGSSLTFTIPSYYPYQYSYTGMTVQLSVVSSRGTSNKVDFIVWGSPYTCGNYGYGYGASTNCNCNGYGNNNGYQYGYNNYNNGNCNNLPPNNTSQPTIQYITPTSGGVGTSVTIFGTGFTTTGNAVHFGSGVVANLNSYDGRSVSFTVPSNLSGFGSQPITLSTYNVSVTNGLGITSNAVPFAVTSTAGSGSPVITSVTGPTTLSTAQQGTWQLVVDTAGNSYLTLSVNWGDVSGYAASPASQAYGQGQFNSLTHTYYQSGTYTIQFIVSNSQGQQNTYTTTVVVGGSAQNYVSLSYLSPQSGRIGQQIQIVGTGFTPSGNVVHFGNGGIMNVSSVNGNTIYFTVPSTISPCDVLTQGNVCAQYLQQVTPGSYPMYVTNASGATSNTLSFQVIQ